MSIYAIEVYSGREIIVKQLMEKKIEMLGLELVRNIHAFETFTRHIGKRVIQKLKSAVTGYVFIEIDSPSITDELYYFIKSVPCVKRILKEDIQQDQFERFFQIVSEKISSEEEPIIQVMVEELGEEKLDENKVMHSINTSPTKVGMRYWLDVLKTNGTNLLDKLKEIKQTHQLGWISRCRIFTNKNGQFMMTMPYQIYYKIKNLLDPEGEIPPYQLTKRIIHHIVVNSSSFLMDEDFIHRYLGKY